VVLPTPAEVPLMTTIFILLLPFYLPRYVVKEEQQRFCF